MSRYAYICLFVCLRKNPSVSSTCTWKVLFAYLSLSGSSFFWACKKLLQQASFLSCFSDTYSFFIRRKQEVLGVLCTLQQRLVFLPFSVCFLRCLSFFLSSLEPRFLLHVAWRSPSFSSHRVTFSCSFLFSFLSLSSSFREAFLCW